MKNENKLSWVGLRQAIAQESGCTQKEAAAFLSAFVEQLSIQLQKGETIRVSGLGTFRTQNVQARESINVQTGERITIPGYNKLSFATDSSLLDAINLRPQLTPNNDPIQKLGKQANEILDILADLGQGPKVGESVEEPIEEKVAEESIETEETKPEAEPAEPLEEPTAQDVPHVETVPEAFPCDPTPLEVEDIQSPNPPKPPFRPWLVAGITMGVFCILLIAGYIFLQHKVESWINSLREKNQIAGPVTYSDEMDEATIDYSDDDASEEINTWEEPTLTETATPAQETSVKCDYSELITTEILPAGSRLAWVARKYYGERKLWVFIYDANKDHLKNPSVILPGTEIRVPKLTKELRDVNNPETQRIIQELEDQFLHR